MPSVGTQHTQDMSSGCWKGTTSLAQQKINEASCTPIAQQQHVFPFPCPFNQCPPPPPPPPTCAPPAPLLHSQPPGPPPTGLEWDGRQPCWEDMWHAIKAVWASKWNSRAVASLRKAGLQHDHLQMAVLCQPVIPAKYAFVAHTTNPVTGAMLPCRLLVAPRIAGLLGGFVGCVTICRGGEAGDQS